MVWIHGGGFLFGSASDSFSSYGLPVAGTVKLYDGATLASRHNVVVVVIQYRLGPFGFLPMPSGGASARGSPAPTNSSSTGGSNGLGDQISALQWVQWHIHRFGEDPSRVTIFGESSGSVAVCALLHSPLANGLFHRAILQSGVCYPSLDYILTRDEALAARDEYLNRLVGNSGSEAASLDLLERGPADEVIRRTLDAFDSDWVKIYLAGLGAPSVDGEILPDLPVHLTPHAGVDVLAGVTSFDQTVASLPHGRKAFLSSFGLRENDARAAIIEKSYPAAQDDANLFLDACLRCQTQRVIQRTTSTAGGTGHWYVFDCPHGTALHASDISATFGNIDHEAYNSSSLLEEMMGPPPPEGPVERVQEAWVAFARTGDPGWSGGASFGCDATTFLEDGSGAACDSWVSAADALGGRGVGKVCMSTSYLASPPPGHASDRTSFAVAVVGVVVAACLVLFSVVCLLARRRRGYSPVRESATVDA